MLGGHPLVVMWPLAPNPPCKQMLAVVGGGCWAFIPPFSSLSSSAETQVWTTQWEDACWHGADVVIGHLVVVMWPLAPNPPCEQMLAAVSDGCWAFILPFSSLALSPVVLAETQVWTTQWADAHQHGAHAVIISPTSPSSPLVPVEILSSALSCLRWW